MKKVARMRTGLLWLGAGLLLAVVTFGGAIQAGFLAPQLHVAGEESIGRAQFQTIQNISWRSWNITDAHLANGASSALVAGHVVRLTLHEGPAPTNGRVGPPSKHLVVGPGDEFNLRLTDSLISCRFPLRDLESGGFPSEPSPVGLSAEVAISTPFGVRNTDYEFYVSRC
jgi:hypothetical protein